MRPASGDPEHVRPAFGDPEDVRRAPGQDRVDHTLLVAGESEDRVDLLRFDGETLELLRSFPVGRWPTEIDGPHGLAAAPRADRWYVTLAHGNPFGYLAAYDAPAAEAGGDPAGWSADPVGEVELGMFPATVDAAPSGLLFVANFDLHGDPVPGSVSAVDAATMQEIVRIGTCARPHGSRLTRDGRLHYSVCVADDELVEIDALRLRVARRLALGEAPPCSPTWAQPAPDGSRIYVTCNRGNQVLEVDAEAWAVVRRLPAGPGPYNLDVTPDGRLLVVTYRSGGAVGIWDLERGEERARVETTRRLPHGIAISPDGRYAFVSVEGVRGEPGAVEAIDLDSGLRAATADVGKQAGGIVYWRAVGPAAGR